MADNNDSKNQNAIKKPANQSLSNLIDEDLQKESELLQNLIRDVVDANKDMKQAHEARMEEARHKLTILNKEIARLKSEINQKESDTTLEQLNYMLDAKNRIYEALQEMRQKNIDIYMDRGEERDLDPLKDKLFSMLEAHSQKHIHIAPVMDMIQQQITTIINTNKDAMIDFFDATNDTHTTLKNDFFSHIETLESTQASIDKMKDEYDSLTKQRRHVLQGQSSDQTLDERIEATYKERRAQLAAQRESLEKEFNEAYEALINEKENIETATLEKLKKKNHKQLQNERDTKTNLENDLKDLRLEIIRADKKGDEATLSELFSEYNRKQKASEGLFEEKLQKKAKSKVTPKTKKINAKLFALEKNHLKQRFEQRLSEEKERLDKNDSKERFKLREDNKALTDDLTHNQRIIDYLLKQSEKFETLTDQIIEFKRVLDEHLLIKKQAFLELESTMLEALPACEQQFKEAQLLLSKRFRLKTFEDARIGAQIKYEIDTHSLQRDKHQRLAKIDKRITDEKNSKLIESLEREEDIQSEKIYQRALIELADKEYELQLLKIQSLYDNEIDLTNVQAKRLNIGHDVNESMVSTTLESQINFAKQQIKYAHNEYDLRLENIEQTLQKEREYAQEKLDEHQQPYKTDRHDIIKERDQKLEDLAYKQALFTDDKDKRSLKDQENKLRAHYDEKIKAIEAQEAKDPYVKRYKKQIDTAENRAEKAREDARDIRDKSIATYESMLESSEEKLRQYKEAKDQSELSSTVEHDAKSTAHQRYDENIEEAKALYEEKIQDPTKRLETLDEQLKAIHESTELKETIAQLETEKASIKSSIEARMEESLNTYNENHAAIESEKQSFLEQHDKALSALKKQKSSAPSATQKDIEHTIKDTSERLSTERQQLKATITRELDTLHKTLEREKKALDKIITPPARAYEKHINKYASLQKDREKRIRKDLTQEYKVQLRTLKRKYKHK